MLYEWLIFPSQGGADDFRQHGHTAIEPPTSINRPEIIIRPYPIQTIPSSLFFDGVIQRSN